MARNAWSRLLAGYPQCYRGPGAFPIAAYSEFQGPVRLRILPYGTNRTGPRPDGPGWPVSEREEAVELRPGLEQVAAQLVPALARLGRGEPAHGIARSMLENNPYWPARLAAAAASRTDERYVTLMPLALSRTQDALGESAGPSLAPASTARRVPSGAVSLRPAVASGRPRRGSSSSAGCSSRRMERRPARWPTSIAGLRILPQGRLEPPLPAWPEGPLPRWTEPLLLAEDQSLEGVRYLLTFRPFGRLPERVQQAYATGALHLLPFPGSLLFWGDAAVLAIYAASCRPHLQIPLLWHVERHAGPGGLRVPQSGWMHEPQPAGRYSRSDHGPLRNTYRRTHRYVQVLRDAPAEQTLSTREDRMAHVLFDASEAIGLYGKPMARNAQLWTADGRAAARRPAASHDPIERAARADRGGRGVRLPLPVPRHARRPARGLLASAPGQRISRRARATGRRPRRAAGRADRFARRPPRSRSRIELWPELLARAALCCSHRLCSVTPTTPIRSRRAELPQAARRAGRVSAAGPCPARSHGGC